MITLCTIQVFTIFKITGLIQTWLISDKLNIINTDHLQNQETGKVTSRLFWPSWMLFGILSFLTLLVGYIGATQFYLLLTNHKNKTKYEIEKLDPDDTYMYFLKVANHNNISLRELCEKVTVDNKFLKYCVKFNFKNNGKELH